MSYAHLLGGAAFAAALSLATAIAWAAPGGGAVRDACAADVKAVCAGVKPGGGRIVACMREHADQLSPGCQQAIQARSTR